MALVPDPGPPRGIPLFRHILVPLDGSSFAEAALPAALAVAEKAGAHLHLLTVREPDAHIHSEDLGPPGQDWCASYLLGLAKHLEDRSPHGVTTHVSEGSVPESIEAEAAACDAGLVVMASHGRGGASRAWLGSVTDAFVRHTARPVAVVRPSEEEGPWGPLPDDGIRRILVPLDGRALAERIIPVAQELAALFGASLHVVRAVPFPRVPTGSYIPHAAQLNQERVATLEDEARAYLSRMENRLAGEGSAVTSAVVVVPQAARGILAEASAASCDVVAMATHARGTLRRAVLGSTTDKVLRATDRIVLLLHPSESTD